MKVLLAQCELEHLHQPPHLAMALYARDLRGDGHEVRTVLVHPTALGALEAELRASPPDLVALDSIFPLPIETRIRAAAPRALLVVGGHNAAQHALRGSVDVAVVGNGRAVLRKLARDPGAVASLPGTLRRLPDGRIDAGPPPEAPADPFADVFPFEPDLFWDYLGPARAPEDAVRAPSIVAEVGCPYEPPVARSPSYAGVTPRLPDAPLTAAARALLEHALVSRAHGCAFCTFRYQPYRRRPTREAVDALVTQALWLVREAGAASVSLQTESPFPYLVPLLDALHAGGVRLDELRFRGIPWAILAEEDRLREAIGRAGALGTRLVLQQAGFESFADADLDLFHKGIGAADNLRCARLLADLERESRGAFTGTRGHGLILFHPFTTVQSLSATADAVLGVAPFLAPRLSPDSRLELYGEWIPIFWKVHDAGLAVAGAGPFGWDWRYREPGVAALDVALRGLLVDLESRLAPPAGAPVALAAAWTERARAVRARERPWLFREALRALLDHPDDEAARGRAFREVGEASGRRFG